MSLSILLLDTWTDDVLRGVYFINWHVPTIGRMEWQFWIIVEHRGYCCFDRGCLWKTGFYEKGLSLFNNTLTWMLQLIESGEKERLKELLRERLIECGWRDELKAQCRLVSPALFVYQVWTTLHWARLYCIEYLVSDSSTIHILILQWHFYIGTHTW